MNLSSPFINRPVGTTLLTAALALAGILAYFLLPVSPLPQVEFPTIQVSGALPGASPETMASAVATPLERQFGHISGLTEMTSSSGLGSTSIVLQFDLSRSVDAAARDVQAAINAASAQLPANLPSRPTYRKVNPAEAPILIFAVTSDVYDTGRMYDAASSILQQKISQVEGVGQVIVGGGALPAVRVDVNPNKLNNLGLGLEDIRTFLASANVNRPKGRVADNQRAWTLDANDQLLKAEEYRPLIVTYANGAAVRLSDIATVTDSVENIFTGGIANGKPAVAIIIFRQPNANVIATVDRLRALVPQLQASIPPEMRLTILMDRSITIRASVADIESVLLIATLLVIMVVFIFLRDLRTTFIPSVAVPASLLGTLGVMYLGGYSIDNLSLMALTIATGFVVDDAIVVIEDITRYVEQGMIPLEAARRGAREIGFTVVSMSASLVAVFMPILLMGGMVGRLFREFAITLSTAIIISLFISLTTTPMMCAKLLRAQASARHGRVYRALEWAFDRLLGSYEFILIRVLRHPLPTILVAGFMLALNVYLFMVIPKELFPQQDIGRLTGRIVADQAASPVVMKKLLAEYTKVTGEDPAIDSVVAFVGGPSNTTNIGSMFIGLKPLNERRLTATQVIGRLRGKLARIPGATMYLQAQEDLQMGGRISSAEYQFTLSGTDLDSLNEWTPKMLARMKTLPGLIDVNSDLENQGLAAQVTVDRTAASRLGLTSQVIDNTLYDAFGQRQVSTMYTPLNQYHVVMEVDLEYARDPGDLDRLYVFAPGAPGGPEAPAPLSAFAHFARDTSPLVVNHQSQFPAATISFNLRPGTPLGTAVTEVERAEREMMLPASLHGQFAGAAQAFQESLANEPWLVLAALIAVYIVLGILYESLIHPITILSTLPSAGVGALLTLLLFRASLSVIALIGIILLIGIVKKNAILMIDFALDAERTEGKSPRDAIYQACLLRFRPITMTTMAALLGALPLALSGGMGSELRRPLGLSIVGGLIFSQAMTLFTTPIIYLYMDRFRLWSRKGLSATQHK